MRSLDTMNSAQQGALISSGRGPSAPAKAASLRQEQLEPCCRV